MAPVLSSDASPDGVPEKEGKTRYRLSPPAVTGAAFSQAEVQHQNEWEVTVTLKDAAKAAGAKLFDGCSRGDAECPTKQAAIVLDGVVQSAPTVNAPNLALIPFVITGSFEKREAQALAAVLATKPLPANFTVRRR